MRNSTVKPIREILLPLVRAYPKRRLSNETGIYVSTLYRFVNEEGDLSLGAIETLMNHFNLHVLPRPQLGRHPDYWEIERMATCPSCKVPLQVCANSHEIAVNQSDNIV